MLTSLRNVLSSTAINNTKQSFEILHSSRGNSKPCWFYSRWQNPNTCPYFHCYLSWPSHPLFACITNSLLASTVYSQHSRRSHPFKMYVWSCLFAWSELSISLRVKPKVLLSSHSLPPSPLTLWPHFLPAFPLPDVLEPTRQALPQELCTRYPPYLYCVSRRHLYGSILILFQVFAQISPYQWGLKSTSLHCLVYVLSICTHTYAREFRNTLSIIYSFHRGSFDSIGLWRVPMLICNFKRGHLLLS